MSKILLACEESQAVTKEFRKLGHEAYSCDILPSSGGHPEWHITNHLEGIYCMSQLFKTDDGKLHSFPKFDMTISFPPCTDLAVSGSRWFEDKRKNGSQRKSILFFLFCWRISNATENPIGIMNNGQYVKKWFPDIYEYAQNIGFPWKPAQIIQPWQFGHGETKATCLWLNGLPPLQPTNIVSGREARIHKMPPGPDRGKLRSKTYAGIAQAMASQWSALLLQK